MSLFPFSGICPTCRHDHEADKIKWDEMCKQEQRVAELEHQNAELERRLKMWASATGIANAKVFALEREVAELRQQLSSGLSWAGKNVFGNAESIEAVKTALHEAGTIPALKQRIAASADKAASVDHKGWSRADFIERIVLGVAEIPDRDSPEDQPEMMLVTTEELRTIIENVFDAADEDGGIEQETAATVQPVVKTGWLHSIDKCVSKLNKYWMEGRGCTRDLLEIRAYIAGQFSAPQPQAAQSEDSRDAARYRWLRNPDQDVGLVLDKRTEWVPPDDAVPGVGGYWMYEYRAGEELDAAIDAALAQAGKGKS